jgi:putative ABC transport system substrate-binding protein
MSVQNEIEMEHAISAFAADPDGGLLLTGSSPNNPGTLEAIARLALYHQLPLMYGGAAAPAGRTGTLGRTGILMAHGPDSLDLALRACSYLDRILRGAKPSELPVQYPTKFELVVNLKTAKAIGLILPFRRPCWPSPTR